MKQLCNIIMKLCDAYCDLPNASLKEKDRMKRLKQMYQQKLEGYDDEQREERISQTI